MKLCCFVVLCRLWVMCVCLIDIVSVFCMLNVCVSVLVIWLKCVVSVLSLLCDVLVICVDRLLVV